VPKSEPKNTAAETAGLKLFTSVARRTSRVMGTPAAVMLALGLCAVWLVVSPMLSPGLKWQVLLLGNLPTMLTVLMVFLVQHTQNHHNDAVQVKLDELIRAVKGAHNAMVSLEELSPEDLARVKAKYHELADRVRASPHAARLATSTPAIDPLPATAIGKGTPRRKADAA